MVHNFNHKLSFLDMDWLHIFSLNFKIRDKWQSSFELSVTYHVEFHTFCLFENKIFDVLRFYWIVYLSDFP